jgi:purine-nucleoside phosphorylase
MPTVAQHRQAVRYLVQRGLGGARLAVVLGSGFRAAAGAVEADAGVAFGEVPGFHATSVPGHSGRLLSGTFGGVRVLVMSGRVHYYEGRRLDEVGFGVRVMAELGVETVLLTNAAGGIRRGFRPGDFMAIEDHINFMGANPLRGPLTFGRERFVDLTVCYDPGLLALLKRAGRSARIPLRQGTYLAVSGPSYETPAEIRMFARWGADAVGMSTVPEAIVARQCGMRVAGLSCITNLAAGLASSLSHAEVLQQGVASGGKAARLLEQFARLYGEHESNEAGG